MVRIKGILTSVFVMALIISSTILLPTVPMKANVRADNIITNKTIILNEPISVTGNKILTIKNSIIIFNASTKPIGINVNNSTIIIKNSKIIGYRDKSKFYFTANWSNIIIENSTLINCITTIHPLLEPASIFAVESNISIVNTEIVRSGEIYLVNSTLNASRLSYLESYWQIYSKYSNITITDSKLSYYTLPKEGTLVKGWIIRLVHSNANITRTNIYSTHAGDLHPAIEAYNSKIKVNDVKITQYIGFKFVSEYHPSIYLSSTNATISNLHLKQVDLVGKNHEYNYYTKYFIGVKAVNSIVNITNSVIENFSSGIYLTGSTILKGYKNELRNNRIGITIDSNETVEIHYSNIINNTECGIKVDSNITIDARYNYWGSPNGPRKRPPNMGFCINKGMIIYKPWLNTPVQIGYYSSTGEQNQTVSKELLEIPALLIETTSYNHMAPGIKTPLYIKLSNKGFIDGHFLIGLLNPYNLKIYRVEGAELIENTPEVTVFHVYIPARSFKRIKVVVGFPADRVFGDNADLKNYLNNANKRLVPPYAVEFAGLTGNEWNMVREKSHTPTELIDLSWNIWHSRELSYFNSIIEMPAGKQLQLLSFISSQYPLLAKYISWGLSSISSKERMIYEANTMESVYVVDSNLVTAEAAGTPKIFEATREYVKHFLNRDTFSTLWHWYKGGWEGELEFASLGLIKVRSSNAQEEMARTYAYEYSKVFTKVAIFSAILVGAAYLGAEALTAATGIEGFQFFTTLGQEANYPTLIGIEAEYQGGIYGNIIKIASNPRFGGWYLGIGHVLSAEEREVAVPGGVKLILPGWSHWYFLTGKIATWSEEAGTYVEYNLYQQIFSRLATTAMMFNTQQALFMGNSLVAIVASIDPNHITSSPEKFIRSTDKPILYTVYFENSPNATAPAYNITIKVPLDRHLDPDNIEIVDSSHPDKLSGVEIKNGILYIHFINIDLPPNKNPPDGEGFVKIQVYPNKDMSGGTIIIENASIIFDYNPPITTNNCRLIYDNSPPETNVNASLKGNYIEVTVNPSDDSNVSSIMLSYWTNNSKTKTVILNRTVYQIKAEPGETYYIMATATDEAGNTEIKRMPDVIISVPGREEQAGAPQRSASPGIGGTSLLLLILAIVIVLVTVFPAFLALRRRNTSSDGSKIPRVIRD